MKNTSSRTTHRLILLGAVTLCGATALALWHRPSAQHAMLDPPATQVASLQERLERPTVSRPQQPAPSRAPAAVPDDISADAARRLADLSAQFASQPRNARWAVQTEGAINDAMNRALANNDLRQSPLVAVECRSSACRVELVGNAEVDPEIAAQWLLLELASELPRAQVVNIRDDGREPETYVFASR